MHGLNEGHIAPFVIHKTSNNAYLILHNKVTQGCQPMETYFSNNLQQFQDFQ